MLAKANMTQTAVASRLGKSKGYVSRVLSGAHNMTLHTLGDLLWATGTEVRWDPDTLDLHMGELGVVEVLIDDTEAWTQIVPGSAPNAVRASPHPFR
jgi:transcriptional regulator with XRE-family HTH domain